jgi:hypothetical protein
MQSVLNFSSATTCCRYHTSLQSSLTMSHPPQPQPLPNNALPLPTANLHQKVLVFCPLVRINTNNKPRISLTVQRPISTFVLPVLTLQTWSDSIHILIDQRLILSAQTHKVGWCAGVEHAVGEAIRLRNSIRDDFMFALNNRRTEQEEYRQRQRTERDIQHHNSAPQTHIPPQARSPQAPPTTSRASSRSVFATIVPGRSSESVGSRIILTTKTFPTASTFIYQRTQRHVFPALRLDVCNASERQLAARKKARLEAVHRRTKRPRKARLVKEFVQRPRFSSPGNHKQ